MKETINANIGQQVFTLDRDAYDRLTIYLNDVRRRITVDTDEVMNDIEIRIAEIFREGLTSSLMVVSLAMVERAIATSFHKRKAPITGGYKEIDNLC